VLDQQEPNQLPITPDAASFPCNVDNVQIVFSAPEHDTTDAFRDKFQAGLRDFNSANYAKARIEFEYVMANDPYLAAESQFYIGEILFQQQDFVSAIRAYDSVLAKYSDSPKAPAAQLHCGLSLVSLQRQAEANRVLRSLIKSYPRTSEAARASDQLKNQTANP
jgi:TolA-binding protein